jgi:hypothetical protein
LLDVERVELLLGDRITANGDEITGAQNGLGTEWSQRGEKGDGQE